MAGEQPGTLIGRYRLARPLGGGGFGTVWRAQRIDTDQVVALKVLAGAYSSEDVARQRADIELLAAAASNASVHVVRVLDGGVDPVPHVVMEYIDGDDLAHLLRARGRFPLGEVIEIGRAVADALVALNAAGIVHRDIKPANVMIDRDGVVKITDFGIAKIAGYDSVTATGAMPLSMAYAAPEVWDNRPTHRSDLYALGILLYQCLTGDVPFTGTPLQLMHKHMTAEPELQELPPPHVPSFIQLIAECLAKDPAERPPDAATCRDLLGRAAAELAALDDTSSDHAREPARFGPWLRRAPVPGRDDAWECVHESTGASAIVEVFASDDLALGQRLRDALEINPRLVAHGAERLLGTNRLILRPGEQWARPAEARFQFWVARETTPEVALPDRVNREQLLNAVTDALAMLDEATAADVALRLDAECMALPGGRLLLRRPGLPAFSAGDPYESLPAWLRSLPLDDGVRRVLDGVEDIAGLRALVAGRLHLVETPGPVLGVAHVAPASDDATFTVTTRTDLVARHMGFRLLADSPAAPQAGRDRSSASGVIAPSADRVHDERRSAAPSFDATPSTHGPRGATLRRAALLTTGALSIVALGVVLGAAIVRLPLGAATAGDATATAGPDPDAATRAAAEQAARQEADAAQRAAREAQARVDAAAAAVQQASAVDRAAAQARVDAAERAAAQARSDAAAAQARADAAARAQADAAARAQAEAAARAQAEAAARAQAEAAARAQAEAAARAQAEATTRAQADAVSMARSVASEATRGPGGPRSAYPSKLTLTITPINPYLVRVNVCVSTAAGIPVTNVPVLMASSLGVFGDARALTIWTRSLGCESVLSAYGVSGTDTIVASVIDANIVVTGTVYWQ